MTADRPVVLVTGATSGIGRATARLLAASGYRVFGTGRRPAAPTLDGFDLLPLDVTDDESASACVRDVSSRTGGRIDVLLNNVGTGILGAAEESSVGQAKALFEVNVFGAVRMTNAVLPLMRTRRAGRVVNMSSSGGVASVPFAAFYCATKHALEAYTEGLRLEIAPFGLTACLIAPGPVSTPAGDTAMRPDRPLAEYADRRTRADRDYVAGIRGGMSPDAVAAVVLRAVRAKHPKPRYRVGASSGLTSLLRGLLPGRLFEAGVKTATRA